MWKVSKYGIISDPYFPVFSPNTRKYGPEKTSQVYDQKRKIFRNNSFVLVHSSTKKIYNEQLTLNSSVQLYHMTEYDIISSCCHNWLACNWLASALALAYHFGSFFIMFSSPYKTIASFSLGHRKHGLELWLYFL